MSECLDLWTPQEVQDGFLLEVVRQAGQSYLALRANHDGMPHHTDIANAVTSPAHCPIDLRTIPPASLPDTDVGVAKPVRPNFKVNLANSAKFGHIKASSIVSAWLRQVATVNRLSAFDNADWATCHFA